ncbi:transposase [Pectobacterium cacticida]
MKTSKFTDSQIMAILKQAEAGTPVPKLCRERGMSSATFYIYGLPPFCKH